MEVPAILKNEEGGVAPYPLRPETTPPKTDIHPRFDLFIVVPHETQVLIVQERSRFAAQGRGG